MSTANRLCYTFLLRSAARVAKLHGVDPVKLLEGTGIAPSALADPYQLISHAQERQFYLNLIHTVDVPSLGLEVGNASIISELGSAGHVQLAAGTIREVINGSHKHLPLLYAHLKWDTELESGEIIHRFSDEFALGELRRFMIERALTVIQRHAEELIGPDCKPIVVTLDYPDPGYRDRYEAIFQCPIKFNQPHNEIHHHFHYLDHPIPTHDPKVREVLDGLCETLMQKLKVEHDVVTDVKLAIGEKPGTFPNIEQVAEKLGMSSRTLRRHLTDQGANFQNLLNDARREVAEDHLRNSAMNVQQIAELCGFSDAQNFAQAFKRWTGQSPTEFRKSAQT